MSYAGNDWQPQWRDRLLFRLRSLAKGVADVAVGVGVIFRCALGLWLIGLGWWWCWFVGSHEIHAAFVRLWNVFLCPVHKNAVQSMCNALAVWDVVTSYMPGALIILPGEILLVGGIVLILTALRIVLGLS